MSLINKDVVLTTKEAIQYLRISKPTYLKYIHLGRIRAVKAGNGWRVYQSELYRFLIPKGNGGNDNMNDRLAIKPGVSKELIGNS